MAQRHGTDRAIAATVVAQREQYATAGGEDVGFRVPEHFLVDRFHHEPASQPFQVQPREVAAPARLETDDAGRRRVHRDRCAMAAVAASRSLSSNAATSIEAMVAGSRQRALTSIPSGWLRGT